jgi:hypothetical protein
MYILTIVRYDTNHGEIEIFLPIKAPTRLMCEKIYTDTVTEDKYYLVKDYEDMEYIDDNFEYSYRIDEYEDLLVIKNIRLISSKIQKIKKASSTVNSYFSYIYIRETYTL